MTPQKRASLSIKGFKVRTNSQTEMTNQGKIHSLWQLFNENIAPQLEEEYQFYGVFFNNDPELHANFDFIAGVTSNDFEKNDVKVSEDLSEVTLKEGSYLVFSAVGAIPQATLRTWQQIRQYFNECNCPHRRAFTTDYEHYIAPNVTKIYISVVEK